MATESEKFEIVKSVYSMRTDLVGVLEEYTSQVSGYASEIDLFDLADHLILSGWIDFAEVTVD